ncbi:MAG: protein phosphatase 2C domain-containing protein [Dactylosporangium sp.]|nr:protein phosphatase 2C domain-containing protein [Dactylosporangium sp.]
MPAQNPRVARIRTAGRPGSDDRPSQDRVFTTPNAVIVLDGASQPNPDAHDGGWLADTLGSQLRDRLIAEPLTADLGAVLAQAIDGVARRYALVPGRGPSSTISIVRWNDTDMIDVLVLGDSPVVALARTGRLRQVRDDRLAQVAPAERQALRDTRPGQFGFDRPHQWQALVEAQRRQRNTPGGYWIAEADPEAAAHAVRARWNTRDIVAVLAMTDGVANGVDRYQTPDNWHTALTLARRSPTDLVNLVHDTELTDPDGTRWPRSKRHDDKALALIEFVRRETA